MPAPSVSSLGARSTNLVSGESVTFGFRKLSNIDQSFLRLLLINSPPAQLSPRVIVGQRFQTIHPLSPRIQLLLWLTRAKRAKPIEFSRVGEIQDRCKWLTHRKCCQQWPINRRSDTMLTFTEIIFLLPNRKLEPYPQSLDTTDSPMSAFLALGS